MSHHQLHAQRHIKLPLLRVSLALVVLDLLHLITTNQLQVV